MAPNWYYVTGQLGILVIPVRRREAVSINMQTSYYLLIFALEGPSENGTITQRRLVIPGIER